jgi:hypothetical protein
VALHPPRGRHADVWDRRGFVVSGESIYVTGGDQLQVLRPETEESEDEDDVEFEYVYELAANAEGDDEDVEERVELSSGEYYRDGDFCSVEFEAENLTDDKDLTVYFEGRVDGNLTTERPTELEAGEAISLNLELMDGCLDDPDQVEIRAWAPHVGGPHDSEEEDPTDDSQDEKEDCPDDEADETESKDDTSESTDDCPEEETEPEPEPKNDC